MCRCGRHAAGSSQPAALVSASLREGSSEPEGPLHPGGPLPPALLWVPGSQAKPPTLELLGVLGLDSYHCAITPSYLASLELCNVASGLYIDSSGLFPNLFASYTKRQNKNEDNDERTGRGEPQLGPGLRARSLHTPGMCRPWGSPALGRRGGWKWDLGSRRV